MGIPWPTIPPPAAGTALGADLVHVTLALPRAKDVWDKAKWDQDKWDSIDYGNFVDVSCDCSGVTVERGRGGPLDHAAPGRVSLQLDNPAGIYSPWNTIDSAGSDMGRPVLGPDVPIRVATFSSTSWVASSASCRYGRNLLTWRSTRGWISRSSSSSAALSPSAARRASASGSAVPASVMVGSPPFVVPAMMAR